jgi:exonuclease SbcD
MRFLHTADWHVGKTLRGRSRMDEFAAALDEVLIVAREARVDVVLVAGDVFDAQAPPPEAEKLVYDFFARLVPEGIACVVIAGNHDHPRKLGALAELLEGLRIHVRTEPSPAAQGGVVSLPSRDGAEEARIAVLPFVAERKIVEACALMAAEHTWYEAYAARLEQMLGFLSRGFSPRTVNVMMAHVLIAGARFGTGERPLHLGDIYGVNAQQIPPNAQYVALGHLHRPQEVLAPSRTFYAGSLLELDFGERDQDKRVIVFEARPGTPVAVESVPLVSGRRLRDVQGSLAQLEALAADAGSDFLRVRVDVEAPVPGLAEQVRTLLPNAVDVQLVYERQTQVAPTRNLGQLEPGDVFGRFYRDRNGADPPAELMDLFRSIYDEASRS